MLKSGGVIVRGLGKNSGLSLKRELCAAPEFARCARICPQFNCADFVRQLIQMQIFGSAVEPELGTAQCQDVPEVPHSKVSNSF